MKSQSVFEVAPTLSLLAKSVPVEKLVRLVKKACVGEPTVRWVNDVVGTDQPEARQGTILVGMVHPPSGPIPLHVIVEVTRDDGRGRTQKPAVAPKVPLQESQVVPP